MIRTGSVAYRRLARLHSFKRPWWFDTQYKIRRRMRK